MIVTESLSSRTEPLNTLTVNLLALHIMTDVGEALKDVPALADRRGLCDTLIARLTKLRNEVR